MNTRLSRFSRNGSQYPLLTVSRLLDDALAQNMRTRQLLQRVGGNVREYENVLSRLSLLLGTPHYSIPLEVLEALSHDPASVMSGTKRLRGWRAVEDICDRINRQRETLRNFAASISHEAIPSNNTYVFDGPIFTLSSQLDQLEHHRERIAREAESVVATLARVKDIQANVKRQYNDVMGQTSLIYPEVWHICMLVYASPHAIHSSDHPNRRTRRKLSEQVPAVLGYWARRSDASV